MAFDTPRTTQFYSMPLFELLLPLKINECSDEGKDQLSGEASGTTMTMGVSPERPHRLR